MDCSTPIDIVYLWVDGTDPRWRQKRRQALAKLGLGQHGAMALYGNVEGRFRDNDELRYSLRALERFFPQHGHVYLVTDGQTPAWLGAHARLSVIDHRELIPAGALPTFDSGHIESYIHHIAGLSERYFYCNDDVFFGAPVNLEDWFWTGGIYVGWSDDAGVSDEALRKDATALDNACRLSHQWLRASTPTAPHYQPTFRTFAHAPRPMRKSVLFELEQRAPELFAAVRSTVFRAWDKPTIVSDFVLRWSLATGLARVRDYAHLHVSSGDVQGHGGLEQLMAQLGELAFFCINDTTDDAHASDPRLAQVREALQTMFPTPSSFEQPAPTQAHNLAGAIRHLKGKARAARPAGHAGGPTLAGAPAPPA
ncbi:MAG: stealth family protein [Gammaproteobacteria bacterium]|nr:exopolysaccharide phosphotransferase [Rhodoferax sp.]MBU3900736.1 stealth family protein [Gammaproteobacteria bacterium]MBU3997186.1 stealth family protein [Gammaproteobacteria bacterium]MBU4079487.1 stealth family protein [Gammaproteobacteria bacterium]MBU4114805.1 stealth family protein [Gammaproteobacteria bacterium]